MPINITNGIEVKDPGNNFYEDFRKTVKPHPKQEKVLQLPDSVYEALYGGAAYGGKSWLLTLLPLFRGFYKYRGFKGIILRRNFPDLEREIIRLSKDYYPQTGATYNETKHSWEWKEYGSYLDFGHVQHDRDVKMYDSAQYNYCAFDELTHFSKDPYIYLVGSRVRPSSTFNIAIVRNGTNPGGIGQNFVFDRFVKPYPQGGKIIRDPKTGLYRTFIQAFAQDNPTGMEYDPLYVKKMEILRESNEALYKAKALGDWNAFKGSVFTTFRSVRDSSEPDNALHVIEAFEIPAWWPRILSIDWGKTAMCYAMWGAISPDKRVYVYRERAWKGKDIADWASEIRFIHFENEESPIHTVLCGSAWQDRGQGSIEIEFTKYSGLKASSSNNTPGTRIARLQVVHDFLRWEQKKLLYSKEEYFDKVKADRIYRIHGPEAYEQYKGQFMDEAEETNIPVLQIFERCQVLIDTIPLAIYDEKKTEDIAEFDGDDPLDCLRYFCTACRRYLNGEIGNHDHQVKLAEIAAQYAVHGDMTRLYRQMEFAEGRSNLSNLGKPLPSARRRSRFRRH